MNRKSFLQNTGGIIGVSLLPGVVSASTSKKKPLRFAHITDVHLKPGAIPEAGFAKALHHIQQYKPGVDFIINGGDSIMDSLEASREKTRTQWDLFKKVLSNENSLPIYHTIGNHDIWGWFIDKDKPTDDPLYGKHWVLQELALSQRYYSFSKERWHFIVLDSTQLNPKGGYIGKLDEEQLNWLQEELKRVPAEQFVCIVSHIPVLSICSGLFFNKTEANGDLLIKRNLMHTDFLQLKDIFSQYPNIRVCISGHIHMQDEVRYQDVHYYCNGAVSGNWWGGPFNGFTPAYAVMELYDDGTAKRTMIKYD